MKITRVINVAALMLGVLLLCQCTKEEKSAVQPQANVPATVKMAYIDSDSLAAKYNFAKDIAHSFPKSTDRFIHFFYMTNTQKMNQHRCKQ